jgi:hypothetical protein
MTGKDQLNILENQFGNYEGWDVNTLVSLQEDDSLKKYFSADSTTEMLKKENEEIFSMIFSLNIGFRFNDSNQRFNEIFKNTGDIGSAFTEIKKLLKSEELFDRLNAYQIIYSKILNDDKMNEKVISEINLDDVIKDMNKAQAIIFLLNENEASFFFSSLLSLIYRIQEFVFENTGTNILIESEQFNDKLNLISEVVLMLTDSLIQKNEEKNEK